MKPKVLVLGGYGLNCDYETYHSFKLAGGDPEYVHINELIFGKKKLSDYHILAVIGGFSYGDDIGAGKVLANKLRYNLWDDLKQFIDDGKLIIGICNGFQAIVKSNILPALNGYDKQTVTLTFNDSGKFEDRWINLKANPNTNCIWTKGIEVIPLPVRHGEGKFVSDKETIAQLEKNNQVVFKYCTKNGQIANGKYPDNPNGAINDIAGICDPSGKVFGIMPHPEAFNHITNHPNWTALNDKSNQEGMGVQMFRNAVEYAKENLL
jgi:phosphoribosylformylglycinamidine synthase subunit PurQ / glutaminase